MITTEEELKALLQKVHDGTATEEEELEALEVVNDALEEYDRVLNEFFDLAEQEEIRQKLARM